MDRSDRHREVQALNLASAPRWQVDRHVAVRLEYVVNQVVQLHRGEAEEEIARIITDRLRALGVPPQARQVQLLAQAIARLPAPSAGPSAGSPAAGSGSAA
ncbi:MAG TPA: hypothetical protein VFT95_14065 [Micromonosporaceae bacterium]|nr:hypothetical protein [Micromonosporaceae bacterium]